MAVNRASNFGHMLLRLIGLSGLFVAAASGLVWYVFRGENDQIEKYAMYAIQGGLGAAAFALLFELPGVLRMLTSRRGAVGGSVFVQVLLALALVGGINVFAFQHYKRFDLTWDKAFTLEPELRNKLANLRGDTEIVVVRRTVESEFAGKTGSDLYDVAAPKQIIAKVKDLAQQFSDLGPNFRVQVLDIQEDDFDKKVKAIRESEKQLSKEETDQLDKLVAAATAKLTIVTPDGTYDKKAKAIRLAEFASAKSMGTKEASPLADDLEQTHAKMIAEKKTPLADAIDGEAKQNSIFFKSGGKVQRLAFHDVYQIDKEASRELWSLPTLSASLVGLMPSPGGDGPFLAASTILHDRKGLRDGRGNLVLNFQGVEPFARKILNIEEKKPRLSVAVVHPLLSMRSAEEIDLKYDLSGAREFLQNHGFETKDILLRKQDIDDDLSPEPAAETFDENRFEQIEEILPRLDEGIKEGEEANAKLKKQLEVWRTASLAELQKTYIYVILPDGQEAVVPRTTLAELERRKVPHKTLPVDEEDRTSKVAYFTRETTEIDRALEEGRKQRDLLVKERGTLNVDDIAEKRRIADVEARMTRMLADVDILVIPRITLQKIAGGRAIPNWVHKLDVAQLKAIKAFMMKGKPVLFLLGPINEKQPGRPIPPQFAAGEDGVEPLLAELGVKLPKQTILYNIEVKEFTERKRTFGGGERELKLPPVFVDWFPGEGRIKKRADEAKKRLNVAKHELDEAQKQVDETSPPTDEAKKRLVEAKKEYDEEKKRIDDSPRHPIRESLSLLSKAVGKSIADDLQIRHPRPVYVEADLKNPAGFDEGAVFLMAGPDSWNEYNPFPNEKREPPRFTPAKDDDKIKVGPEDDKSKSPVEEVRRGPFPIGVAIERTLPKDWFDGKEPTKTRIGVIGSGDVFAGKSLSPIKEKLLLDVTNWLLGRDDLLAKRQETWSFPRVSLSEPEKLLWHWGTFLGLPFAFLFLGMLVWFVRRLR